MARCPAHNDKRPSLSLKELDDRTLIHCFAGCTAEEIMKAIGLSLKDLYKIKKEESKMEKKENKTKSLEQEIDELGQEFDLEIEEEETKEKNEEVKLEKAPLSMVQKDTTGSATVEKRYQYPDEDGVVRYMILRMRNAKEPFYTVRPSEDGEYKSGLGKERPIPYNLPNVIKARDDGEVIFVTEGESKVDVLNELGYTATTAPFGKTDKWSSYFNKYVKRANVLIIADNDDKGREFAELTFETISDVANNVGVLELSSMYPNLKEGGDIEDLRNIVKDDETLKDVLDSIIEDFMSDTQDVKEKEER